MPPDRQHTEKAEHNKKFLYDIFVNRPHAKTYPDWGVTVVFYAAHHHVHAFFARKLDSQTAHPTDHRDCLRLVREHLNYCFYDYSQLYNDSRLARYIEPVKSHIITEERLKEDIKVLSDVFEKL